MKNNAKKYKNKIEEYFDIILGDDYKRLSKLKILSHYVFSRERNWQNSIRCYSRLENFSNNIEEFPSLIIFDSIEDRLTPKLFYFLDSLDEIDNYLKIHKLFSTNIQDNMSFADSGTQFKSILEEIQTEKAFSFEVIFILDKELRDNEINDALKKIELDNSAVNHGEYAIYDIKRLNNKMTFEESESDGEKSDSETKFNFNFKNENNSETLITNTISYNTDEAKILICSISAESLIHCYDKYKNQIFDKNIRYSISSDKTSKAVDSEMNLTIEKNPKNFFMYNNGITIVTNEMEGPNLQDNTIKLTNFSIVNGAQTITNLAKHKYIDNRKNIFLLAKIVCPLNYDGYSKIVEEITKASNNQKPVKPRDFKSNTDEMKKLKKYFATKGIILDIKRGDDNIEIKKELIKNFNYKNNSEIPKVLNDTLGQYIYSLILNSPTISLQNKSKLFYSEHYDKIFLDNKISHLAMYNAYIFYGVASEEYEKILNNIDTTKIKNLEIIKHNIKNWVISVLWIIFSQKNSLNKFISNISDNIKKTEYFFDDSIEFNGFKEKELRVFIFEMFKALDKQYEDSFDKKKKKFTASAFSFKKEYYTSFLETILSPNYTDEIDDFIKLKLNLFM